MPGDTYLLTSLETQGTADKGLCPVQLTGYILAFAGSELSGPPICLERNEARARADAAG